MTTLALAVYRLHRDDPTALLCAQCRWRKPRTDFRETPWHGRAARCMRCEGGGWHKIQDERVRWELTQTREKLHAYQRYAAHLKYGSYRQRYVMAWPADVHYAPLPDERRRPKRQRLTQMRTR